MIPWWLVLAAFVAGVGGAALLVEFGWLLQRAGNGRGRGGTRGSGRRGPAPYDWSREPDL